MDHLLQPSQLFTWDMMIKLVSLEVSLVRRPGIRPQWMGGSPAETIHAPEVLDPTPRF